MVLPQLSQVLVLTYSSVSLKEERAAEKVKEESYETIFHARFPVAQEAMAVAMTVGSKTPPQQLLGLPGTSRMGKITRSKSLLPPWDRGIKLKLYYYFK